jgi:hypothetical protein
MLPLMMCAPMVIVLVLMQRWFVAHTYFQLAVQLFAGGLAYAACVGWAYVTDKAFYVGDLAPPTDTLPKIPAAYQEEV